MEMVSERLTHMITRLEPGQDMNRAIELLLENELIRRLNRYQHTDRTLSRKYRLSFSEFKARRMVEQHGYSFEIESDFWDWEMAWDGIETTEAMLIDLADLAGRRAKGSGHARQ